MNQPRFLQYRFTDFSLDVAERRLLRCGVAIPLAPRVFDTLVLLLENPGHLLEKEDFMKKLWPDTFVGDDALARNISILRKVLGGSSDSQSVIATVPKRGYRFVAEVTRNGLENEKFQTADLWQLSKALQEQDVSAVQPGVTSAAAPSVRLDDNEISAVTLPPLTEPSRLRRVPFLIFTIASGILAGVLTFLLLRYPPSLSRNVFGGNRAPSIHSVAVLPLQNLSHDPEQEYFAQGMTEELITDLAQIGSLRVISSTSSMHYKATKEPLPKIAGELKVDAILEGTVQRFGDHVHITAQLIDASRDQHLWAKTYDRDLRDILSLENEVARSIADEIEIQLTPEQRARLTASGPVDPEAYELYLKGRYFWSKRNPSELRKALDCFQQVADKQPGFAPAFSGLADTYSLLGAAGFDALPRAEAMERARTAASRALELDGASAEAHASMAYVLYNYDWNWLEAEKEFKRAIVLKPNYASAHEWYSEYLNDLGRQKEALAEAQAALELDPISVLANQFVARAHYFARRFDQAIEISRKTIEIDPNASISHLRLGRAYAAKGMYPLAIKEFEEFGRLSGDDSLALASIGNTKGQAKDHAGAMRALNELTEISKQKKVPAICFVLVHVGLGNEDQGMAWLDTAYKERSDFLLVLKVDVLFDPLRSDPRFVDLERRVGVP